MYITIVECAKKPKKMLLEKVENMTFIRGKLTTSRRSPRVHQLECVDDCAGWDSKYMPISVNCTNVGFNGPDIQVSSIMCCNTNR